MLALGKSVRGNPEPLVMISYANTPNNTMSEVRLEVQHRVSQIAMAGYAQEWNGCTLHPPCVVFR